MLRELPPFPLKHVETTRGGYAWSLSTEVATLTRREKEKVTEDDMWMLLQMQFLLVWIDLRGCCFYIQSGKPVCTHRLP